MIQVFKIINGIDRMDPDVFFTPATLYLPEAII